MFTSLEMQGAHFNHSYPIHSTNEVFQVLDSDPRSIDVDLDRISLGIDPRWMLHQWQEMERRFKIQYEQRPEFKYLITASTHDMQIRTRDDAEHFLKYEEEAWLRWFDEGSFVRKCGIENPETDESRRTAPLSAVGFWLFDLDALGDVPRPLQRLHGTSEEGWDNIMWDIKMMVNLRNHRPRLGVFRLPSN